jgi:hypothetical protein
MAALNATARTAIREAGFTSTEWSMMWGYADGNWGGDQCGCQDDRCANGFHHDGTSDCGCLRQMISDAVAWRTATRSPNTVELVGGPYGLNQWVDVTTPAVLAIVSTAQARTGPIVNGIRREFPAESSIRVRVREGWSVAVTHEDNHGVEEMVIRFVRSPEDEAATAAGERNGNAG